MIDSKAYRIGFEDAALEELFTERDRIIDFMHRYENHELPDGYFLRTPSPEVVYFMYAQYLTEILDLIRIRMIEEDFYLKATRMHFYRELDEMLSQLEGVKRKETMERLKADDRDLHDGYMEWKENTS